mmetsp:Transcript_40978/g.83702  ORF Transcript_40978/g.83702 Transcript_40978/m.83702 type:complete len:295 (+) Transcript_40978:164-1048(+)
MRFEDLNRSFLLILGSGGQRRETLSVGLVHICTNLQQVFQELLATISRRIVQPAVARAVHGVGVGAAVQEELHHSDAVGTDGIAQGSDALVVLTVQRFFLVQEGLYRLNITALRGLVQRHGRVLDLLQHRVQLRWQTSHFLADLQHQFLILVVLHGCLHAILLDILKNGPQLCVFLQGLHAVLHRGVTVGELGAVVLGNGLGLQPAAHGIRILGETLQGLGRVWVGFHIAFHLSPGFVINVRQARDLHGGAIADVQGLHCHAGKKIGPNGLFLGRVKRMRSVVGLSLEPKWIRP